MKAVCYFETSRNNNPSTQRKNPEDLNLQVYIFIIYLARLYNLLFAVMWQFVFSV